MDSHCLYLYHRFLYRSRVVTSLAWQVKMHLIIATVDHSQQSDDGQIFHMIDELATESLVSRKRCHAQRIRGSLLSKTLLFVGAIHSFYSTRYFASDRSTSRLSKSCSRKRSVETLGDKLVEFSAPDG